MTGIDVRRARRWFWILTAVAVGAMGALYRGLQAAPSPGTGILVAVSSLMLAASGVQAARILAVLAGPPRLPRWRGRRSRPAADPLTRPRPARRTARPHAPKET
ncbi:hypothetical protein [Streptomyces sp. WAC00263]|uniref:hypothetical protein n=1 Tax=Streptomyces sp. WAC00263 TaxID=1917422 RepID=UPI0015EF99E7|nr:hypothetical protein [Streptomyces sp. WAC00263]KAF5990639.1 hypothetical protein BOG92_000205 [Streptomyces sp. WAC00263]